MKSVTALRKGELIDRMLEEDRRDGSIEGPSEKVGSDSASVSDGVSSEKNALYNSAAVAEDAVDDGAASAAGAVSTGNGEAWGAQRPGYSNRTAGNRENNREFLFSWDTSRSCVFQKNVGADSTPWQSQGSAVKNQLP